MYCDTQLVPVTVLLKKKEIKAEIEEIKKSLKILKILKFLKFPAALENPGSVQPHHTIQSTSVLGPSTTDWIKEDLRPTDWKRINQDARAEWL